MKHFLYSKFKAVFFLIIIITISFMSVNLWSQTPERTLGTLTNEPAATEGYNLFIPQRGSSTYLMNNAGKLVHSWDGEFRPGGGIYLLKNGNLLKPCFDISDNAAFMTGGRGGIVREFDWDGNIVWEFSYSTELYRQHHDVQKLPNGNVLILAWELKTKDEAIAAGRDPIERLPDSGLWLEHIIEVDPTTNDIVWEWHVWDHIIQDFDNSKSNLGVVEDHPELLDFNYVSTLGNPSDWMHSNAMFYNPERDQILLNSPMLGEVYIIDHSTTTAEAASHSGGNSGKGGDILYRWGNPHVYRAGTEDDKILFFQHKPHWITPGHQGESNILIFNNGRGRPDANYSEVIEIIPPMDSNGNYILPDPGEAFGPEEPIWTHKLPNDYFSVFISGAQRLRNGNTAICAGPKGTFFEVTCYGEVVWKYINPVINTGPLTQGDAIPPAPGLPPVLPADHNMIFRVTRYAPDFPGFDGKDLTGGDPIELYPISVAINIEQDVLTNENKGNLTVMIAKGAHFKFDEETIWLENSPLINSYTVKKNLFLEFDNMEIFEAMDEYYKRYDEITLHLTGYLNGEDGGWFIGSDFMEYNPGSKLAKPVATTTGNVLPEDIALLQNYPNPFNPVTNITYTLPEPVHVTLEIYTIIGEKIVTLLNSQNDAGYHTVVWDGKDEFGTIVAGGIYLCRIQMGTYHQTIRMLLLK